MTFWSLGGGGGIGVVGWRVGDLEEMFGVVRWEGGVSCEKDEIWGVNKRGALLRGAIPDWGCCREDQGPAFQAASQAVFDMASLGRIHERSRWTERKVSKERGSSYSDWKRPRAWRTTLLWISGSRSHCSKACAKTATERSFPVGTDSSE